MSSHGSVPFGGVMSTSGRSRHAVSICGPPPVPLPLELLELPELDVVDPVVLLDVVVVLLVDPDDDVVSAVSSHALSATTSAPRKASRVVAVERRAGARGLRYIGFISSTEPTLRRRGERHP